MSGIHLPRLLGGTLLVSGTCIGAGMIGLPVATASGGFPATVGAFILVWSIMTLTAFCMLEVSLWYPQDANLISMARKTLGPMASAFAWLVYLCFNYSILAAYTSGGAALTTEAINSVAPWNFTHEQGTALFVIFFASIVFCGTRTVDWLNRGLMIALIAAYAALISTVGPHVDGATLKEGHAIFLLPAVPMMVTAFGFHLLIPSLTTYFEHRIGPLRFAIFFGALIPLVVYLLWEFMILGTLPLEGPEGLLAIGQSGDAVSGVTFALNKMLEHSWLGLFAKGFTFFALLSSFVGVALALFDFLADGLSWEKTPPRRAALALLTFGPPLVFTQLYPEGFLLALSYAGVFASILLIWFPAVMVMVGRPTHRDAPYRLFAPKPLLWLCIVFGILVVVLHVMAQQHMLPVMAGL